MDTPENVRATLQPGMWVTSIDLKDAYFHIPIHPKHQKFLRFQVLGKVYQFRALPFGLNTSPRLFTKIAAQLKKMGICMGIQVHQYIDDWLNRALSEKDVGRKTQSLLNLIEELGWTVNQEKSDLIPFQVFEFLSYRFDLARGLVFPTEKWFQKFLLLLSPLLKNPLTTPRMLMTVLGLMEATSKEVPLGCLHMRPIQQALALLWDWKSPLDTPIKISPQVQAHIRWWTIRDNVMEGVPLHPPQAMFVVYTDASMEGWGAHCTFHTAQGKWSAQERSLHINVLELKAVFKALQAFVAYLKPCSSCYRQYHCCSIHQQTRRHPFMGTMCPTMAYSGMVSAKEHCSVCQTHSGLPKCHSRSSVPQGSGSPYGVVSASRHFSADMPKVGYSHDRPLCNSFQQQVATVCFASPRPNMSGGGRFVDGLGGEIPVCLSSDRGYSSGHQKTAVLQGLHASVDSSLLADQTMVPRTTAMVNPPSLAAATSVVSAEVAPSHEISQEPSSPESPCMVAEGRSDGLDKEIQERIDNPHRQSTSLFSLFWKVGDLPEMV